MVDPIALARDARRIAVERAGGGSALARELNIKRSAVSHWDLIPSRHVGRISKITGLRPDQLRPDLFEQALA